MARQVLPHKPIQVWICQIHEIFHSRLLASVKKTNLNNSIRLDPKKKSYQVEYDLIVVWFSSLKPEDSQTQHFLSCPQRKSQLLAIYNLTTFN